MKVIMIYGSENDKGYMQPARDYLEAVSYTHLTLPTSDLV